MVKETSNKKSKNRKWPGVVAIILVLYGISLFIPFASPFSRYPLFVIKCRGLPIEASRFAAGSSYYLPSDKGYHVGIFTDYYFCTEQEAQGSGFSH